MNKTGGREFREQLRKKFWPNEDAWTGENKKGWFYAPRTLPLILSLIASKPVSGKRNPSRVYLELRARHLGEGVIEMKHEGDHAYAAGCVGNRGIRTWREHMELLENSAIIKTKRIGNQRYKYVLLVHPTTVVEKLRQAKKVDQHWLDTYVARQLETKEHSFEARKKQKAATKAASKVVSMNVSNTAATKTNAS